MLLTHGTGARTLREALSDPSSGGVDFCGTPDSVAAEMGEAIAEIGGDGFMITEGLTRRTIGEIADGLVPALQRRGLVRTRYSHALFRDNLLEFRRRHSKRFGRLTRCEKLCDPTRLLGRQAQAELAAAPQDVRCRPGPFVQDQPAQFSFAEAVAEGAAERCGILCLSQDPVGIAAIAASEPLAGRRLEKRVMPQEVAGQRSDAAGR